PTIWPVSLMPNALVSLMAKGSSKLVKLPPLRTNPWKIGPLPVALEKDPTIWPEPLMPAASVLEPRLDGPSSIVVKILTGMLLPSPPDTVLVSAPPRYSEVVRLSAPTSEGNETSDQAEHVYFG